MLGNMQAEVSRRVITVQSESDRLSAAGAISPEDRQRILQERYFPPPTLFGQNILRKEH